MNNDSVFTTDHFNSIHCFDLWGKYDCNHWSRFELFDDHIQILHVRTTNYEGLCEQFRRPGLDGKIFDEIKTADQYMPIDRFGYSGLNTYISAVTTVGIWLYDLRMLTAEDIQVEWKAPIKEVMFQR